jgi:hypothetical protein
LKSDKNRLYFSIASFIIPFAVYITTLAPGLYFIDTGELATVCIKLGIAHPTGYPLFTILGSIFSKIPIGEYIYRLNLMCALQSSLTVMVFFNLVYFILTRLNLNTDRDEKKKFFGKNENNLFALIISFSSSMVLAFSSTFWDTSNSIEVYSLHVLFVVSVMYIFLKACNEFVKYSGKDDIKYWLLFAFILGLSFTNHLTTVFLSVGFIYLYFAINGFNKIAYQKILLMGIPFVLALTVYVYFFIRGDNNIIAWGNPVNLDNFYRHVSGKQFSIWMFTSTDSFSKQFAHYIDIYPKEFFYFPLIVSFFGLVYSFIKQRKFFYYTILLFIFNIFYASNYDIHDIDTYFLLSFVVTVIWFALGLRFIFEKMKLNIFIAALIAILIPLTSIYGNFKENNLSKSNFVKEYTENIFKSAAQNSIIVSTQWDFWVSASFYFQYVNNYRPDVAVIDKELMRKTWYIKHLNDHYPEIYSRSKQEFEAYKVELQKFEKFTDSYTSPKSESDRQNLIAIQTTFINLLNSIVSKNYGDHSFYTTMEVEDDKNERFAKEYTRIPEGLLFKFTKSDAFDSTYVEPDFVFTKTTESDYYHTFIMNAYYLMYLKRANYLMNITKLDTAEIYIKRVLEMRPNDKTAIGMLKRVWELRTNVK